MVDNILNVEEFVPGSARPRVTIIRVSDCERPEYADSRENKGIKGCLLHIRHHSLTAPTGGTYSRIATYSSYSQPRTGTATRPRSMVTASYDRILFFADLSSTRGRCFAMILPTSADSRHILQHARTNVGIGHTFIIVEPHTVSNSLSLGLPLVTTDDPLVPLRFVRTDIPEVPIRMPSMNDTLYFANHGVQIQLSSANIMTRNVSCRGTLCDRQNMAPGPSRSFSCGCLHVGKEMGIVLESRVKFEVPVTFDESGSVGINNVRSWRLTRLFISVPTAPEIVEVEHNRLKLMALRRAVGLMTGFVNRNGGWTMVGWQRQGSVVDHSSEDQTDQVANQEQKLHLSYLYPTDPSVLEDGRFTSLRYDPTSGESDSSDVDE